LDGALDAGFRPGMGHAVTDRLFWAQAPDDGDEVDAPDSAEDFLPGHDTRH
jgi:hydroxymethylpyrimidine/phosphomethylpyrimidine kinase